MDCQNFVKAILYLPRLTNTAVEWDKRKEIVARQQLQVELGIEINDCGLFIDAEFPYLAATPNDLIIGDDTIVEIKCPCRGAEMFPIDAMLNKIADIHRIFDKIDNTRKTRTIFIYKGRYIHITKRKDCVFAV